MNGKVVVTGAAGFIGGHLSRALLDQGCEVLGIDALTPTYDPALKRTTLDGLAGPGFRVIRADLCDVDLKPLLEGAGVVFHLAGQPGVRDSWEQGFEDYARRNVLGTQRLLEAVRQTGVPRIVYSSSSSVYGQATTLPAVEDTPLHPASPYGVSKLAGEHLCDAYSQNCSVTAVCLRYFTVYGPRQRPDMAFTRFITAALDQVPVPLYGDGSQERDFTYVGDVVAANLVAATAECGGWTAVNVAGGRSCALLHVLDLLGELIGRPVPLDRRPTQRGDVVRTSGSIERAHRLLGWSPQVGLREGLAAQVEWMCRARAAAADPIEFPCCRQLSDCLGRP